MSITEQARTTLLTAEQWEALLHDPHVTREEDLQTLLVFFDSPGHGNYTSVVDAELRNLPAGEGAPGPVNARVAHFVMRIDRHLDDRLRYDLRDNGKPRYWNIPFTGKRDADGFRWTLRPELIEALEQYLAHTDVLMEPVPLLTAPYPLNQILYGPPGTGKTYRAVTLAMSLLEGKAPEALEGERRTDVLHRFRRQQETGRLAFTTFHQSLSYEDFVEGIKPGLEGNDINYQVQPGIFRSLCTRARAGNLPHVLIIDEINRGNVSAIFGELITLLESNKRLGRAEELRLTLPYSREEFGVPANVYVIGTMNTADRSVEALDAALRRRFTFTEVEPDPEVIRRLHLTKGKVKVGEREVDLAEMLTTLNRRLTALRDRDHRLGHSYFLEADDWEALRDVLYDRILPLLREYFFADYGQLQLVVGNGFCRSENDGTAPFGRVDEGSDAYVEDDHRHYVFPRPETAEELAECLDRLGI